MSRSHACLLNMLTGFGGNRAKCFLSAVAILVCAGATADPQSCYEITRVDTDPPEIELITGTGLNDEGVVVGFRHPFNERAFAWRDGAYTDLHAQIDPSALKSFALAINNHGDILGNFSDAHGGLRRLSVTSRRAHPDPAVWQADIYNGPPAGSKQSRTSRRCHQQSRLHLG